MNNIRHCLFESNWACCYLSFKQSRCGTAFLALISRRHRAQEGIGQGLLPELADTQGERYVELDLEVLTQPSKPY